MLFSMSFMGGLYIALIELGFAAVLLNRDYNRYASYVLPFAAVTLAYPLLVAVTVWIKNQTGSFQVTFLNNILVNAFCFTLARFLGEKAQMHLIILSQFPIIFLFYRYGSWRSIVGHIALVVAGVSATLISYRVAQPIYPLPDDLADLPGYLCWTATFGMLVWYSAYNWKHVHLTEKLLEDERDQTKGLLNETIPKLEKAEAKYRHLVDDSDDLIFQADTNGVILSMNKTSQRMLSTLPEDMVGRSLYDFIADGGQTDADFRRRMIRELVRELLRTGRLARVHTTLNHKHRPDGVEVLLSLQLNRSGGSLEILGKATEVEPEASLRFLHRENGRYILVNNVVQAELLSQRITERVALHFNHQEIAALRTCLREVLVNAIEHGNLEVSFEEKSRVIEQQDYMEFLLARQKEPRFADRRVQVYYMVNRHAFVLRVTDDGNGFDHKAFFERASNDDSLLMLEHGRGLTITRNAFDEMDFNEKGNQITLKKYITKGKT